MAVGTRWNTKRLDAKLSAALATASGGGLERLLELTLKQEVAEPIEQKIRASGVGGSHNDEFANQEVQVFRSAAGRVNINLGWINPPGHSKERGTGGKLWYQYQDSGFYLFGGARWQEGIGATIDRRENMINEVERVCNMYVKDLARTLN